VIDRRARHRETDLDLGDQATAYGSARVSKREPASVLGGSSNSRQFELINAILVQSWGLSNHPYFGTLRATFFVVYNHGD
jgi:hypothetical protein